MADDEWLELIERAIIEAGVDVPSHTSARSVFGRLQDAGITFPDRGRRPAPVTVEDHLAEACRLLEESLHSDETLPGGYHVWDDHCRAQVGAAEVHARIAHAMTALAMVCPPPDEVATRENMPGLTALERLAAAMELIAARTP